MRRALTLQCAICKCNSVVGLLWIQGKTDREICKRSNILTFYISLQTTTYWDISTILPTFNVEIFPASASFKLLSLFVHVFYIITYKPNYPIPMLHNQWLHRSMTLFFCDIWVFFLFQFSFVKFKFSLYCRLSWGTLNCCYALIVLTVGDGLDAPLRHCKSTWLGERR